MRLTAMGKLIILILAGGLALGGWKFWQKRAIVAGGAGNGSSSAGSPGAGSGFGNAVNGSTNGGAPGGSGNGGAGGVEIPFAITAAKKDWVGDQVNKFNAVHAGKWTVVTKAIPSREAMQQILAGAIKPVLWSPGSPIWPARLAEAWPRQKSTILDMSDPNAYRVFLRSPLIFLTTRRKAQFLRPLLGGTEPWVALRKLSTGQIRVPWGRFRFSHADPLTSSSGMLTLGLALSDYAQRTQQSGSLEQVANSSAFMAYVREMERGLIYDEPARKGTTALTKAFIQNPASYDVITAYESAALEAAPGNPDLAVIYPSPTAVSEHAVSLLNADWVSPQQREGALAFIAFLGSREALQAGIKYKFRPAQSSGLLSLGSELSRFTAQGFKETYATSELPPYLALNAAAYKWSRQIAPSGATL